MSENDKSLEESQSLPTPPPTSESHVDPSLHTREQIRPTFNLIEAQETTSQTHVNLQCREPLSAPPGLNPYHQQRPHDLKLERKRGVFQRPSVKIPGPESRIDAQKVKKVSGLIQEPHPISEEEDDICVPKAPDTLDDGSSQASSDSLPNSPNKDYGCESTEKLPELYEFLHAKVRLVM